MSGEIPAALGGLEYLTRLYLSDNQLTGEIPEELGRLVNLVGLSVAHNQLSGEIPEELGELVNLRRLWLQENGLSGEIPEELGKLVELEQLSFSVNGLTGKIPAALGDLGNLEKLWLHENKLTGDIPAELGKLEKLEFLTLYDNQLSGCLPGSLSGQLTTESRLGGLGFCGDGPAPPTEEPGTTPEPEPTEEPTPEPTEEPTPEPDPERAALVALYDATGGLNWVRRDKWGTDWPVGQWDGVTTDARGRVIKLELHGNRLKGRIPAELGNLVNLEELRLDINQLSGEIPEELGNLVKLEKLWLHGNGLTGEIPAELGNLVNLEKLSLYGNQLSGNIPGELGNLENLKILWIHKNKELSGCVPLSLREHLNILWSRLGGLGFCEEVGDGSPATDRAALKALYDATDGPNWLRQDNWFTDAPLSFWYGISADEEDDDRVARLSLGWNQLSGEIPPELGSLARLTDLSLGPNKLSGEIPAELGNLANLRYLYLGPNKLSGEIPAELGELVNLNYLYLGPNKLSGEIPQELGELVNLRSLWLQENDLSGEIPAWLGNLDSLRSLDLAQNQLRGEIPQELGELVNLRSLWLQENDLSGEIPDELGNLVNLETLSLYGNQLSGNIPRELGKLTNLKLLRISGNQLTGCVPGSLQAQLDLINSKLGGLPFCTEDAPTPAPPTPEPTPPTPTPDPTPPLSAGEIGDWMALTAFYNRMGGRGWRRSENWGTDAHVREWQGVLTDENGRVTGLNLQNNNLTGNVPAEVVNLTALIELRLNDNALSGPIQPALSSRLLSNLELLNLSDNGLSGEIPASFADMSSLETLWLHGNQFTGCTPLALRGLVTTGRGELPDFCEDVEKRQKDILMELQDAIGKPIIRGWGRYDWPFDADEDDPYGREWYAVRADDDGRVTHLFLRGHDLEALKLSGEIPWGILAKLESLQYLDLSENKLSGTIRIPPQLGNLENLEHLDLGSNNLTGAIPPQLSRLKNLEYLDLSRNQLTGAIPEELADLENLRVDGLHLYGHEFEGCVPIQLKGRLAASFFDHSYVGPEENIVGRILDLIGVYLPDPLQSYLAEILNQEDLAEAISEIPEGATLKNVVKPESVTFGKIAKEIPGFSSIFDILDLLTQDWFISWVKGSAEVTYGLGAPPCTPAPPPPATSLDRQSLASDRTALLAIRQYYLDNDNNQYDANHPRGHNRYAFDRYPCPIPVVNPNRTCSADFNWPEQGPVSQWHGVTVEGGRVVGLEITDRLLEGGIPPQVGDLGL